MPEYLSPGVYVEEIDAGPKPIEGVSTSTAGAVGVTQRGPTTGKPVLVTSFLQFERTFGGFLPEPDAALLNQWALDEVEGGRWWQFPLSVKGFFDNGGQRLYVKRAFSQTATTASVRLARGLISEIITDAPVGSTELRLRHTVGIDNGTVVALFVDGVNVGNFNVQTYSAAGSVVLNNPVAQELKAGRDFVQIIARTAVPAGPPDERLRVEAKASGDWGGNETDPNGISAGNGLRVRVRPVVGGSLKMLASATLGGEPASTALRLEAAGGAQDLGVTSVTGFANNDRVQIGGAEYSISNVAAARFNIAPVVPAAGLDAGATVTESGQVRTTLAADAAPGANFLLVNSVANLANGDTVNVGGTNFTISVVTAPGRFTITPVAAGAIAAATDIDLGATTIGQTAGIVNAGAALVVATNVAGLANGDVVDIDGNNYTISGLTEDVPGFRVTAANPNAPPHGVWAAGTSIRRLRAVYSTGTPGRVVSVQNATQLYPGAIVELDNGVDKEQRVVESVTGDSVTLSTPDLTLNYFEDQRLRIVEGEVAAQYRRNHVIVEEEVFSNLRFVDDGGPNYIVRQINEKSELINLVAGADFAGSVSTLGELPIIPAPAAGPQRSWADLTGGADNLAGLTPDDFAGAEGGSDASTGVKALEYIDEISICLAPGIWSSTVHSGLIGHCELLKDRFAIIDPPSGLDIEEMREFREPIDTKYAAIYYPWIVVRDPLLKRDVYLAPSGHMAGIYARVDVERGVHKAPANEVIRGIRAKDAFERDVSKREQDLLNPRNINALRFFPGRGNRVWGARTLSSDSSWKYINVRRLFIYVEESIDEGTQWVVFEPNDEPLWARVRQTVTNFLLTVWRSGALEGTKQDEAFFVKCDRTTMTQADIDNGKLICIIGIAPVKPAEFVIFRIQQKTREATGA